MWMKASEAGGFLFSWHILFTWSLELPRSFFTGPRSHELTFIFYMLICNIHSPCLPKGGSYWLCHVTQPLNP
jgi:hypothetical protein